MTARYVCAVILSELIPTKSVSGMESFVFLRKCFVMREFKDRRSIRKYKRQEVPEEMIAALAEEASRAATMGNMQLYSLVVTTSGPEREALAEAHHHQPMVEEAPAVLTFCADFHRFSRWCEERKAEPGYGNFVSFINAATDTLLFAQAFITLAEERGLGTCILGTTVYNPDRIIRALHLPRLVVPVLTVTLGWPDESPEQTDRLPVEAILHNGHYHEYTSEDIDRIYAAKEALPESRYFVELNGTDNLAQVFTRFRFTEAECQEMSAGMREVLERQGFSGEEIPGE